MFSCEEFEEAPTFQMRWEMACRDLSLGQEEPVPSKHQSSSSLVDKSSSCVTCGVGLILSRALLLEKRRLPLSSLVWQGLLECCRWHCWQKWSWAHSPVTRASEGWMQNELGPESRWLYSSYKSSLSVFRSQAITCSICIFCLLHCWWFWEQRLMSSCILNWYDEAW